MHERRVKNERRGQALSTHFSPIHAPRQCSLPLHTHIIRKFQLDVVAGVRVIHRHALVVRQLLSKVLADIGFGEGVIREPKEGSLWNHLLSKFGWFLMRSCTRRSLPGVSTVLARRDCRYILLIVHSNATRDENENRPPERESST
jgi:hypothetical protein